MNKRCGLVQKSFPADQFLIATGQRPALLPIKGQEYLHTSTDFSCNGKNARENHFFRSGVCCF